MKKLKKVLSLVLVLAMVFSFASTAFAAGTEYADDDQIQNGTAVAVMSGIGIIDGKDGNKFDPSAKFLRSEAAKIMTYMILTPGVAADVRNMELAEAPFPDVPVDQWYAPYVAYVAGEGLVGGWGGNFHPTDELGREQWLKMVLGVLGYDTKGLEGTGWEIKTRALAIQAGIVNSESLKLEFNRDTAVLYAWNAMTEATYVKTDDKGNVTEITDKDGKAITYGEKNFGLKKVDTDVTDDFGRPATKYTWTGNDKGLTLVEEPVLTYADKTVTVKDNLQKDLKNDKAAFAEDADNLGGKGSVVEVYKTADENVYAYVVIETYADKLAKGDIVSAEDAAKEDPAKKAYIKLANPAGGDDLVFETADFAEDDVVLYTVAKGEVKSAVKAEVKAGTVTATGANYVRIDGVKVELAANTYNNYELPGLPEKETPAQQYYYDTYGNLVYGCDVPGAEVPTKKADGVYYVLQTRYVSKNNEDNDGWGSVSTTTDYSAQAKVVDLTDGEVKVIDLTLDKDGKPVDKDGKPVEMAELDNVNAFREVYKAEDGTYALDATNAAEVTVTAKDAAIAGKFATDGTAITALTINVDPEDETKVTYTVATSTGIPAFDVKEDAAALIVADKDKNIENLYVVTKPADPEPAAPVYAIFGEQGETDAKGTLYSYVIGGEPKDLYTADDAFPKDKLTKGDIITVVLTDGKVTKVEKATVSEPVQVTYAGSYINAGGVVNYADKYEVYDETDGYKAGKIAYGDYIKYVADKDDKLVFALIVEEPKA